MGAPLVHPTPALDVLVPQDDPENQAQDEETRLLGLPPQRARTASTFIPFRQTLPRHAPHPYNARPPIPSRLAAPVELGLGRGSPRVRAEIRETFRCCQGGAETTQRDTQRDAAGEQHADDVEQEECRTAPAERVAADVSESGDGGDGRGVFEGG